MNGKIIRQYIPKDCEHNAHMYYIKTKDINERTKLIQYLKDNGIQAVFHYIPLHSAPAGKEFGRFHGEDKYTTKESERLVRLPIYYNMAKEDSKKVVQAIHEFYK